jgi:hypothetical protein
MVSTISFIQGNLQHSIAASRVLARTVIGKGIDIALIQEQWYRENCIRGLNIPGYTLYSAGRTDRTRSCILVGGHDQLATDKILAGTWWLFWLSI